VLRVWFFARTPNVGYYRRAVVVSDVVPFLTPFLPTFSGTVAGKLRRCRPVSPMNAGKWLVGGAQDSCLLIRRPVVRIHPPQ